MSFKLFLGRLGLGLFHLIDDMILLNAEALIGQFISIEM